jgi:2'-5' RNA ligase
LYGFCGREGAAPTFVDKAKEAAAQLAAAPFRVAFNCVKSFSSSNGGYPLVLTGEDGVIGLMRLNSSLRLALRKAGLRPKGSSIFTPHVTMLYDQQCIDEQPIEPICWTVRELALVLSLTGETEYISLGRWRLRG